MSKDSINTSISSERAYALGVPRIPSLLAASLKASNTALSRHFPMAQVEGLLKELAMSRDPLSVDLGALSELYAPLAQKFSEALPGRTFYDRREAPAPFGNWTKGGVEASAVAQMKDACELPVSVGGALMPDAHTGYGLPIGGVLAVRNAVIPYAVGVDIACRMRVSVLDIPYGDLEREEGRLTEAIESETSFGVGARFYGPALRHHPVMDDPLWQSSPVLRPVSAKALNQLGSSGSGNHFVEFGRLDVPEDIDEPTICLKKGTYLALLSHSGSRGAGETVAKYYSALAASLHPELPENLKRLAWLDLGTEYGRQYWDAMELMGRYASANHELIHESILRHLGASCLGFVENHHNFAWKENYGGEDLIVHRKGATPASEGVLGVIPGSMGTPGFIVRGKGSEASFRSCSHGAGRKMSRSEAFRTLKKDDMLSILDREGVKLLSGPLDESPEVYKDIREVIAAQQDLIDVLATFHPKLVKMAPEGSEPSWRQKKAAAKS